MAYAIQRDEPVSAAVRRIMGELITRAHRDLSDDGSPLEERIHDARKRFKETRALLRMVREPLGAQYALENAWFRDLGRHLAGPRDATAVMESLEALRKRKKLPGTALRRARILLKDRRERIAEADLASDLGSVGAEIEAARARLEHWPPIPDSFESLEQGLLRAYRRGRTAMDDAVAGGMPQQFHEWRKAAKVQWYHALLLRNVWPEMMKAWAGVLEDLSGALGDHHDLVVLRQIVASSHGDLGRRAGVIALLDAIDERQAELAAEGIRIGRLVYSERPRAWLARIRNAWAAWQS